jgi:hypothetical protein
MGLFDIFKKKEVLPPPPPPPVPQPTQTLKVEESMSETLEDVLSRLLVIDINTLINNGNDWLEQTYIDGSIMNVKAVPLTSKVLGIFDLTVISKIKNGTIYIDFLSQKYAPNVGLRGFIEAYSNKFGPDTNGKGICTQADVNPLKEGRFRRIWNNVAILQTKREGCISLVIAMRITLHN